MKEHKENQILEGLRNHDPELIRQLYQDCLPLIEKMVINKGGDSSIAKDIFQDALLLIYRKVKQNKLNLSCKLSTYIYSICKNLWIQEYRSNKNYIKVPSDSLDKVNDPGVESKYEQRIREIYDRHFSRLSRSCQKILKLHFKGKTISDIQNALDYDSPQYTMDRKYRCKSSLIKRIMNDLEFKEIKDEIKKESDPLYGGDAGSQRGGQV
jgi:RNA polymerase sigma factor (sigma-70 family)